MKRAALLFALLCTMLWISATPARAWKLVCEAAIPVTMLDSIDSSVAYPGERFRFKLTITARVNGHLLPAGTIGYGYVREVSAASNRDRNGSLILEPREFVYRGMHVQVMADPRDSSIWAPAQTLAERATGYLPIPGLVRTVVNTVRDGRNVTIGPGFTFHVVGIADITNSQPCHKVGQ